MVTLNVEINCARNYENVLNFVRVMHKILVVPFFMDTVYRRLLVLISQSIKYIRDTHNIQRQNTQCIVNVVQRVVPKEQMLRLWATK